MRNSLYVLLLRNSLLPIVVVYLIVYHKKRLLLSVSLLQFCKLIYVHCQTAAILELLITKPSLMLLKQLIYHTFFKLLLLYKLLWLHITSHGGNSFRLFKLLNPPNNLLIIRVLLRDHHRINLHHGRWVNLLMNDSLCLLGLGKLLVLNPFFKTLLNSQSHYVFQGGLNM